MTELSKACVECPFNETKVDSYPLFFDEDCNGPKEMQLDDDAQTTTSVWETGQVLVKRDVRSVAGNVACTNTGVWRSLEYLKRKSNGS